MTRTGISGLAGAPTALQPPDAQTRLRFGGQKDVDTVAIGFQALPRLETAIFFSDTESVGSQTALSFKWQILEESGRRPALSLGVNNLFRNGTESAEYIVASKRFGKFDASLGLGWGRFGDYASPAAMFADRPEMPNEAFAVSHLFKGSPSVFGGLGWQSPVEGLRFSLEANPDGFSSAPVATFGVSYRVADAFILSSFASDDGDVGFGVTFSANPKRPLFPPNLGNAPPIAEPRSDVGRDGVWASSEQTRDQLTGVLAERLAEQSIWLKNATIGAREIAVSVRAGDNATVPKLVGRTARVLSGIAPDSVDNFVITVVLGPFETLSYTVQRDAFVAMINKPGGAAESWVAVGAEGESREELASAFSPVSNEKLSWSIAPVAAINIVSGGDFEAILAVVGSARYQVTDTFYVGSSLSYRIGASDPIAPPAVPTARSDGSAFDRTELSLDRLYGTVFKRLSPQVYGRLSFGLFEREYGGVSAETLWAPDGKAWALGLEVTAAHKRDYDDPFGFQDFDAVTSFGSLYWETGVRGISAQLDVGKYLSGDYGATLSMSRSFANGWEVSASTTVSEDNRDTPAEVAVSVSIPLSALSPIKTKAARSFSLGGTQSDAGARVDTPDGLYRIVRDVASQRTYDAWQEFRQ